MTRSAFMIHTRRSGACGLFGMRRNRGVPSLMVGMLVVAIFATGCAAPAARTTSEAPPEETQVGALPEAELVLPRDAIWLESLDLAAMEQSWGEPHAARSIDDHPLTLGGKTYRHGVGTCEAEMH